MVEMKINDQKDTENDDGMDADAGDAGADHLCWC